MSPTVVALAHASRRRCPRCGARLFDGWFRIRPVCPGCGLLTDRGEHDYFLGALLLNVIAAQTIAVAGAGIVMVLSLPTPQWGLALGVGIGLAIMGPLVGYPFAKVLWLAMDMQFRPPVSAGDPPSDA